MGQWQGRMCAAIRHAVQPDHQPDHAVCHTHTRGSSPGRQCPAWRCPPYDHPRRWLPCQNWRTRFSGGWNRSDWNVPRRWVFLAWRWRHLVSGDDKHQKMHLSKKPKPKLRFLSQNLPKPTDNGNFGNVTTLSVIMHLAILVRYRMSLLTTWKLSMFCWASRHPDRLRAIWSVSLWMMTSKGPCCSSGLSRSS